MRASWIHAATFYRKGGGETIIQRVTTRTRRATAATVVLSLAGVVLFVVVLRRAGIGAIAGQLANLGWGGFGLVLLLSGLRLALRSLAWMQCVEGPGRLHFRHAFAATLMGEALGKVTSLSNVVSEPAKALAVRAHLPFSEAFAAVVVENIVYGASLALLVVVGAVAFLLSYDMPAPVRWASVGAIGGMLAIVVVAVVLLGTGIAPVSGSVGRPRLRRVLPRYLADRTARIRQFEQRISRFARRCPERLLPLALCECAYHAAGVAEVYVTLSLVGTAQPPTLLTALILESAGRVINVVFTFVPLRVGVDEAGSGLLAGILRLGAPPGVTLALVRKARLLVWTGVGIGLLLYRGLSVRRALDEAALAASAQDPAGTTSLRGGTDPSSVRRSFEAGEPEQRQEPSP